MDTTSESTGRQRVAERRRRRLEELPAPRLRRRPSGEPPPLPHDLGRTGKLLIGIAAALLLAVFLVVAVRSSGAALERADSDLLRAIAGIRTPWLTAVMRAVDWVASPLALIAIRGLALLLLIAFRRWRHLFVFVGSVIVVELLTFGLSNVAARPRPFGVTILAPWEGFSLPSRRTADVAVTLVAIGYSLIPHGRYRDIDKLVNVIVLCLFGLARVYLGVDHPGDVLVGGILGFTIPLVGFRWFCPNEVFPVTYGRGKTAHLDVGGRRGLAIRTAMQDQLGLTVTAIKPIGLEGSGGSTPVRLTVAGTDGNLERHLFAKVYAKNHVRADRWYKLGRDILYGGLEDETPFKTVRRFVEYEDYALRLLYDEGLPTPEPHGIVEITPEREYMIVMEFFDGAVELGEAQVTDAIIDQGLHMIRRFWDLGLAHRDVKPSNLMVRDDALLLIDVFFVQVRPSPWRQAVDLGNMMLTLALKADAKRVYERALEYFTEDELAEAFAATRGVASPTQVRAEMKKDDRDLLRDFRALAPERPPIPIQRWSIRRVGITVGVGLVSLLVIQLIVGNWRAFA